ncbi:MAG: peptide ABC transporter substrate-binding protein [Rhabdochlamydiaceae bacterium]|nr:peptide ABC transporter substrate-binding protein [Candidatus Amphrikana amoebophyrae]
MKKKNLILTLCLGTMLACFSGCNTNAKKGDKKQHCKPKAQQTMKINIVSEPFTLDPRKARRLNDINLAKMFMEGLTREKKDIGPVLAAAKDVSVSDDGLVYTFTLRDSNWTNGDPVTSYDFAYSWKKVLSPDFVQGNSEELFIIKNGKDIQNGDLPTSLLGVKTPDEKTLVVSLEYPAPYFLTLVSSPAFFPVNRNVDKKHTNWACSVETYIGNGPFKLGLWNHRDRIVAIKNEGYWDEQNVQMEKIEMLMVSQDTGLKMFENNEIQWDGSPFSALPRDAMESLKNEKKLQSVPAVGTYLVQTNTLKGPLQSENIRRALALAINRADIVNYVTVGDLPSTGIVPTTFGLQDTPYFKDGDHQSSITAFELGLKELNISKEQLNDLSLTYIASELDHKVAQTIQQQWFETLGVLVKLDPQESTNYCVKRANRDFDLLYGNWIADFSDAIVFLKIFDSKNNLLNSTNWENPEVTKTIASTFICRDKSERQQLLKNAEKMIMDAMPAIPIYNYTMHFVKDSNVKNVELNDLGHIDFKWAFIDNS